VSVVGFTLLATFVLTVIVSTVVGALKMTNNVTATIDAKISGDYLLNQ
jgi:hypothetical protein